jgi:archaellum component FlaC
MGQENPMPDDPENLVLVLLRRIDARVGRLGEDVQDLKHRMTSVERQLGELRVDIAGVHARIDRVEARLDRIEQRLDLAETPA